MPFTSNEILQKLDSTFQRKFHLDENGDAHYTSFLDLEHGYCWVAGSRIHLYADEENWAIVLEQNGYHNRQFAALIELYYFGNCIDYVVTKDILKRKNFSNHAWVTLISYDEFQKIESKSGTEEENFEHISAEAQAVKIRDQTVSIEQNPDLYQALGIELMEADSPSPLICFDEFIRYLHETNPTILQATETEIKQLLSIDLPKIMTIDDFHYVSIYENTQPPSKLETYQLIAKVLAHRDATLWQPTLGANNHWSNWESGIL